MSFQIEFADGVEEVVRKGWPNNRFRDQIREDLEEIVWRIENFGLISASAQMDAFAVLDNSFVAVIAYLHPTKPNTVVIRDVRPRIGE